MTGIHQTARKRGAAGALDTAAFSADDLTTGLSTADCTFNTDGTATLTGSAGTAPADPRWWTSNLPPDTWMSYSATGSGTITGGLTAGTRYQLNTPRTIGLESAFGVRTRTFTVTFYDAASGGTTLGTKTFTASVEGV